MEPGLQENETFSFVNSEARRVLAGPLHVETPSEQRWPLVL